MENTLLPNIRKEWRLSLSREDNNIRARIKVLQRTLFVAVSRGLALFIGGFSLLNIVGELRCPGFDANHWWIDLRPFLIGPLSTAFARIFLAMCSVFLLSYAIRPVMSRWRSGCTLILGVILLFVTAMNAANFYILLWIGKVKAGFPIAFSLFVATALSIVCCAIVKHRGREEINLNLLGTTTMLITIVFCLVGFPLAQIYCFGKTDYSRRADAIVVLGARVYTDGRLSDALDDRVRTGARLYLKGYAPKLIMSGGPGDGNIHETEAMQRMAVRLGVPISAILRDQNGLNTEATVSSTCEMFNRIRAGRVLLVSHFYHLPRIKMTYQRRGREVYTVPARESYLLTDMPRYILREIAALWVYYLRPIMPTSL